MTLLERLTGMVWWPRNRDPRTAVGSDPIGTWAHIRQVLPVVSDDARYW